MKDMKEIKGYEDQYFITKKGEVYSTPKDGKPKKFLKQETMGNNYKRVTLSKNGITKRFLVHRLVAIAFISNPEKKNNVNHIDNIRDNNHVNNLEWCTHSENMMHAEKQGRLKEAHKKSGYITGKLRTKKTIKRIKYLIGKTFNQWEIIGLAGKRGKKQTYYVNCICLSCGKVYEVCLSNVTRGLSKQCRSCGLRKSHENRS